MKVEFIGWELIHENMTYFYSQPIHVYVFHINVQTQEKTITYTMKMKNHS